VMNRASIMAIPVFKIRAPSFKGHTPLFLYIKYELYMLYTDED